MHFATVAGYLGRSFGPGSEDTSWTAPVIKFRSRALAAEGLRRGTRAAMLALRVCGCSTLHFAMQCQGPARHVIEKYGNMVVRCLGALQGGFLPSSFSC